VNIAVIPVVCVDKTISSHRIKLWSKWVLRHAGHILLIACFACHFISPSSAHSQQGEYRGMWVTRDQIVSRAQIEHIVEITEAGNFNALFVQVCGRGLALYDSQLIPKDPRVEGWDPLEYLLRLAHARGIQVHAWVNALYVWSDFEKRPDSPAHVMNSNPEWLLLNSKGSTAIIKEQNIGFFIDPSIPQVQGYVVNIYEELARRYPVDGIHLDYIRYPHTDSGYSPKAESDFFALYGIDPPKMGKGISSSKGSLSKGNMLKKWNDLRKGYMDSLVHRIRSAVRSASSERLLISAAVISNHEFAKRDFFQDWPYWMEKGYLDIAIPMAYSNKPATVQEQVVFAARKADETGVMILGGLGAWYQPETAISSQIQMLRGVRTTLSNPQSLGGVVLFSFDKIGFDRNYISGLRETVFTGYAAPSLLPGE